MPDPPPKTPAVGDGGYSLTERVFGGLANKRRRYILYYLQDWEHTDVETLASQITAWEQDASIDEVSDEDQNEVLTSLLHSELPKLADYGLIEYDQRSGALRYTDPPALLEETLALTALVEKPER